MPAGRGKLLRRQMIKVTSEQTERGMIYKEEQKPLVPFPRCFFIQEGAKAAAVHTNAPPPNARSPVEGEL